jgi:hypothetical protein
MERARLEGTGQFAELIRKGKSKRFLHPAPVSSHSIGFLNSLLIPRRGEHWHLSPCHLFR